MVGVEPPGRGDAGGDAGQVLGQLGDLHPQHQDAGPVRILGDGVELFEVLAVRLIAGVLEVDLEPLRENHQLVRVGRGVVGGGRRGEGLALGPLVGVGDQADGVRLALVRGRIVELALAPLDDDHVVVVVVLVALRLVFIGLPDVGRELPGLDVHPVVKGRRGAAVALARACKGAQVIAVGDH